MPASILLNPSMNIHPPQFDDNHLEISADFKYLESVSGWVETVLAQVEGVGEDPQAVFALKLAVHEICVNIIEHAYHGKQGLIRISFQITHPPPKIVVQLCDQGDAADAANFVEPNLEEPQVKGYGLYLVKNLVDNVEYTRNGGTNQWTLMKALS